MNAMTKYWRSLWMTGGMLAAAALPAAAQTAPAPKVELAGGYQWLHGGSETLKKGWFTDLAVSVSPTISVEAQVDGSYNNMTASTSNNGVNVSVDGTHHVYHAMGGVRITNRKDKAASAFAHALAGVQRQNAAVTATVTGAATATQSGSASISDFAVEAGGGVNIRVGRRAALRFGGDYLRVFNDGGLNIFRVTAGLVVPFGSK